MATIEIATLVTARPAAPVKPLSHGAFRSPKVHRWLRTFHRAAGLLFGVFITVVGITGILVEIEMLLGPGAHGGRGVFGSTVHFLIMDLHTFFIFGLGAGLAVELLVTTALILFCASGLWFYAVLFRQWLKLAIKDSGYVPSKALRTANRFMAWVAIALVAVCAASAVVGTLDWAITRPAVIAANNAHLQAPPVTFGAQLDAYNAAGGPAIMLTIAKAALIYFVVVGLWYSARVFVAWRRTSASRAGKPAQPAKAMRTIHRWLSVPFGIYLIVIAFTGVEQIPTLWTAGHLPFLHSSMQAENMKREAIIAKNKTLPPDQQIPLTNGRGGGGAAPAGGAARAGGEGGPAAGGAARTQRRNPLYGVLSQYFVEVHSGAVFGSVGRIFVICAGLALVFFSISGIWMYVSMYMPRRESGRNALIWH